MSRLPGIQVLELRWPGIAAVAVVAAAAGLATYRARAPGKGDRVALDRRALLEAPFAFAGRFAHSTGAHWFWAAQPHCTPDDAERYIAAHPPGQDVDGAAFVAACEALAGRVDLARAAVDSVAEAWRADAAGPTIEIAWAIAHVDPTDPELRELAPMLVAEQGSARVEYLAGAVAYIQGDRDARIYLAAFRATAADDLDRSYLPVVDTLTRELASPPRRCGTPIAVDPDGLPFFAFRCRV